MKLKPIEGTPVESYEVEGTEVFVKREDMACPPPGPPFSKVRGLYAHLKRLRDEGVKVVGYVETSVSMAGWGVAWYAKALGMKAVIYDPQYTDDAAPGLLREHRAKWDEFGAIRVPIKAGMAKVNFNICRPLLKKEYPGARLLFLGLPLRETIDETAKEWRRTMKDIKPGTTVICVGSGTICAGLLRGWEEGEGRIIGVMCRGGDRLRKAKKIEAGSGRRVRLGGHGFVGPHFGIADPGWEYTEASKMDCPFPTHPYYDLKAWEWLRPRIRRMPQPVLFWNIGRLGLEDKS